MPSELNQRTYELQEKRLECDALSEIILQRNAELQNERDLSHNLHAELQAAQKLIDRLADDYTKMEAELQAAQKRPICPWCEYRGYPSGHVPCPFHNGPESGYDWGGNKDAAFERERAVLLKQQLQAARDLALDRDIALNAAREENAQLKGEFDSGDDSVYNVRRLRTHLAAANERLKASLPPHVGKVTEDDKTDADQQRP